MCLKPIKINNPAKNFDLKGGQPLKLEVPCGCCAECKKQKRLEWYFRSFQQCCDTLNKGGFVYFDTLTYSDENVPRLSHYLDISTYPNLSDFMCFNHIHWRSFLKNMRRQLHYYFNDVKFKYFLTSEYGTDPLATHRPHYHILFFVYGNIDPVDFSSLVSKCWPYGRTDGIPFQSHSYIMEHVFSKGHNDETFATVTKLCNYVSKYVTKDSTFQKTIDERISLLSKHLDDDKLKEIKHSVDMFHRCSQGFGLSYINNLSSDEKNFIFNNGACRMGDSAQIKLVIKLPLYYKRKLFYKCFKNEDDTLCWLPTNYGKEYLYNMYIKSIKKCENIYKTFVHTFDDTAYNHFQKLLGNRTLEDFVIYKLFYQYRLKDVFDKYIYRDVLKDYSLTDTESNLYDWLYRILDTKYVNVKDDFNIACYDVDTCLVTLGISFGNLFDDIETITIDKQTFIKKYLINENSCLAFRNFDKLDCLFKQLQQPHNEQKQKTFDFIEELTKKFKLLYYE